MWYEHNKISRNKIRKCGNIIISETSTDEEKKEAMIVINQWRTDHTSAGTKIRISLGKWAKNINKKALVVQRLKRLRSIQEKLRKTSQSKLNTIQDIVGCRIILPTVDDVITMVEKIKKSRMHHTFIREDDYIDKPKLSGYRSRHLIYQYKSENVPNDDGLYVEIQVRTKLQHIWATAVETASVYLGLGQNLKAGEGDPKWHCFFALMSSLFAIEEGCSPVAETPSNNEIQEKLLELVKEDATIFSRLQSIQKVAKTFKSIKQSPYYVLIQNHKAKSLDVNGFARKAKAIKFMQEEEEKNKKSLSDLVTETIDIVMVSAKSLKDLKQAYPNYFSDIEEFYKKVEKIIKGNNE